MECLYIHFLLHLFQRKRELEGTDLLINGDIQYHKSGHANNQSGNYGEKCEKNQDNPHVNLLHHL